MGSDTINITYETLFDFLRNEKKPELQQLPATFYADVVAYLKEKGRELATHPPSADLDDERRSTKQLQSIHRIVRDLYEMRERKIVDLAVIAARGSTSGAAALLPPEKELFERMLTLLKGSRSSVLARLLASELPRESMGEGASWQQGSAQEQSLSQHPAVTPDSQAMLVRFLAHVPKFLGTELEVYGPFEPGDMASLPREIADILIAKKRAAAFG